MHIGRFAMALAALSLSATAALAEQKERKFTASSPWLMDYAKHRCSLQRDFSDGQSTATMTLERSFPGDPFSFGLASDSIKASWRAQKMTVTFGPGGARNEKQSLFTAEMTDGRKFLMVSGVGLTKPVTSEDSAVEDERVSAAEEITTAEAVSFIALDGALKETVHLHLGSFAAPLKALQVCVDDLMSTWGLDPETQRSLTRKAGPPDEYLFAKAMIRVGTDYMKGARKVPPVAALRVMVDSTGKPTSCMLSGPTGYEDLDRALCSAAGEQKFDPALDAKGNPVASAYLTQVRFWLK